MHDETGLLRAIISFPFSGTKVCVAFKQIGVPGRCMHAFLLPCFFLHYYSLVFLNNKAAYMIKVRTPALVDQKDPARPQKVCFTAPTTH